MKIASIQPEVLLLAFLITLLLAVGSPLFHTLDGHPRTYREMSQLHMSNRLGSLLHASDNESRVDL